MLLKGISTGTLDAGVPVRSSGRGLGLLGGQEKRFLGGGMFLGDRSQSSLQFLDLLTGTIDLRMSTILDGPHVLSQVLALDSGSVLQFLDA